LKEYDKLAMTIQQRQEILKKIYWDANISGELLYAIAIGQVTNAVITQKQIFLRMIERLGWHNILEILGIDNVKRLLTKETVAGLRNTEMRERYEFIRSILFGEVVSFTGWGDEYYQKIKHTLFSNRWYRSQQTL
jgi:hypothetical protein